MRMRKILFRADGVDRKNLPLGLLNVATLHTLVCFTSLGGVSLYISNQYMSLSRLTAVLYGNVLVGPVLQSYLIPS